MLVAYEPTRLAELRANVWTFACRRESVAEALPAPAFGYAHKYAVPVGCVRILDVGERSVPLSMAEVRGAPYQYYKVEGSYILCDDAAPLPIRYVADVQDASAWDPLFYDYLALRLAWAACMDLVKDGELHDRLAVRSAQAWARAVQVGAIEEPPTERADDSWILSRG